jgi:hypothetical protein
MIGYFRERRRVRQDAIVLMLSMPGKEAWLEARARGKDFDGRTDDDRMHWWRVSHYIDRALDIDWMPDTATRWLESPTT